LKHYFVINPKSGKTDNTARLGEEIKKAFENRADEYEIYITRCRHDATAFVRQKCAENTDEELRFYACGGDGTLNEVLNGMVDFPNASVGVVPCGSGNDFVRCFPQRDFLNIEAQLAGEDRRIDVIKINDAYTINIGNAGLDADVAENMKIFKKWPLITGSGAYNISLVYTFFKKLGKKAVMSIDGGEEQNINVMLMLFANGQFYGGSYKGAPLSKMDDGLMDICIVPKISRLAMLRLIGIYKKGDHVTDPAAQKVVKYMTARHVEINYEQEVTLCMDGEVYKTKNVTAQIIPLGVRLHLPAELG